MSVGDARARLADVVDTARVDHEPVYAPAFVGAEMTPWLRFPGQTGYSAGVGVRTVEADGTFNWRRATGKKVYVYFRASETERSNRVVVPAR